MLSTSGLKRLLCIFSKLQHGNHCKSAVVRLSTHEIPAPNIKPLEGSQHYVRMAPWGRRHEFMDRPQQPPELLLSEADILVSTSKRPRHVHDVGPDQFKRISELLFRYNFNPQEIQNNPGLFSMRPEDIEDRLELFKECGWEMYTADMVIFINIILAKRSAKQVIGSDSFSVTRSVLRGLLDTLGISDIAQQGALDQVTETSATYLTLADCRTLAVREYMRTLYPDPAELQMLMGLLLKSNQIYRPVKSWKSQFEILLKDLQIPPKRLLKYPALVRKGLRHFQELLEKKPAFNGIDIRLVSSSFPHMVLATAQHLEDMEKIFEKYGITSFQVSRQLPVVVLSCETLERRLQFLKKDPYLWKFHKSPDFVPLIIKFGDVMRRVSFLRSMGVNNFGLALLICSRSQFHLALNRGAFRGPDQTVKPQHLVPLAEWLAMPLTDVRQKLRSQISKEEIGYFANDHNEMQKVLKHLSRHGISRDQLHACLSLALYPADVVEKHLTDALNDPSLIDKRHKENFLHYVLYSIEKFTNFRGPAVWTQKEPMEEVEEEEQPIALSDVRSAISQALQTKLGLVPVEKETEVKKEEWFE